MESFLNDIPVFSRTFQVLWGSSPAHINREGNAIIPNHVFWILFLCCSIYIYLSIFISISFFFFYGKDMESQFFADKTIYGQGSPACIITKYCQLHNVFTINLFPSESFPERDFVLAC